MKKISMILKATYVLAAILLCTSFSSSARLKRAKRTTKTSPESRGYNVKVGETFSVSLPSNPTTGYSWQWLVSEPEQARYIKLIKKEYTAGSPIKVGSGGTTTFTFQAQKSTKPLALETEYDYTEYLFYCRVFSGEVSKIFRINLTITE